jgi:hypothetical protein
MRSVELPIWRVGKIARESARCQTAKIVSFSFTPRRPPQRRSARPPVRAPLAKHARVLRRRVPSTGRAERPRRATMAAIAGPMTIAMRSSLPARLTCSRARLARQSGARHPARAPGRVSGAATCVARATPTGDVSVTPGSDVSDVSARASLLRRLGEDDETIVVGETVATGNYLFAIAAKAKRLRTKAPLRPPRSRRSGARTGRSSWSCRRSRWWAPPSPA